MPPSQHQWLTSSATRESKTVAYCLLHLGTAERLHPSISKYSPGLPPTHPSGAEWWRVERLPRPTLTVLIGSMFALICERNFSSSRINYSERMHHVCRRKLPERGKTLIQSAKRSCRRAVSFSMDYVLIDLMNGSYRRRITLHSVQNRRSINKLLRRWALQHLHYSPLSTSAPCDICSMSSVLCGSICRQHSDSFSDRSRSSSRQTASSMPMGVTCENSPQSKIILSR